MEAINAEDTKGIRKPNSLPELTHAYLWKDGQVELTWLPPGAKPG